MEDLIEGQLANLGVTKYTHFGKYMFSAEDGLISINLLVILGVILKFLDLLYERSPMNWSTERLN